MAAHPGAHLVMSAEHAGSATLVNSGSVLARNSPVAREILASWWSLRNRSLFSDQEQFDQLYQARRKASELTVTFDIVMCVM